MKNERRRFQEKMKIDRVSACSSLASAHYSLIKRYSETWFKKPVALWHFLLAVSSALRAVSESTEKRPLTANEADVVTRILSKTPSWLAFGSDVAVPIINEVLYQRSDQKTSPHTRALLLLTMAEMQRKRGQYFEAVRLANLALQLQGAIQEEDSYDREYQLIRVWSEIGFLFYDCREKFAPVGGRGLIRRALVLSRELGVRDQEEKIESELKRRGIVLA